MSRAIDATIFVNQGNDRFFYGYREGDPLTKAASITIDATLVTEATPQGVPALALEYIFEQLNVDHPSEEWAVQWRRDEHPSMSIGDVIVFGETAYALSRYDGWKRIALDSRQIA